MTESRRLCSQMSKSKQQVRLLEHCEFLQWEGLSVQKYRPGGPRGSTVRAEEGRATSGDLAAASSVTFSNVDSRWKLGKGLVLV